MNSKSMASIHRDHVGDRSSDHCASTSLTTDDSRESGSFTVASLNLNDALDTDQ
jgi:hypothetical protein